MGIFGLSRLLAIVPIAVLLTISFFVLLVLRKVEEKGLKAFGYVVVGFLWLAALVIFSGAVNRVSQGHFGMRGTIPSRMRGDAVMFQMMQKDNLGPLPAKGQKRSGMPKCGANNKGIVFKAE
jgi:hypothetical protein